MSSQRLPVPGSDDGDWGNILNGFLGVSHNADGSLQPGAVTAAGAGSYTKPGSGIPSTDLASEVQTDLASANSAVQIVNNKSGNSITLSATDVGALTETTADGRYAQLVNGTIPVDDLPAVSASTVRSTSGPPSVLATDISGDFAIDMNNQYFYGPFNGTSWPAGVSFAQGVQPYRPTDYGFVGMTLPNFGGQAAGLYGSGSSNMLRAYFMRFRAFQTASVSHMDYWIQQLGSNLSEGYCFMGLYDTGQATSGHATKLELIDTTSIWASGSTGPNYITLSSSVSLTAGEDYYAVIAIGQPTSGSTAPTFTGLANQLINNNYADLSMQPVLGLYNVSSLGNSIPFSSFYAENTIYQVGIRV